MPFTQVYSQAIPAPKLAQMVDLSTNDWIAPAGGVLSINPQPTSTLYVGVAGDLNVVFGGDPTTSVLLKNHPPGYALIGVIRILRAGTTAGFLVALF